MTTAGPALARAWVGHLATGGTIAWSAFVDAHQARPWAGDLPGAQNLELLRRLNQAGPVPAPVVADLLGTAPPGRGRPTLPLLGAGDPAWGVRPVDPAALPVEELVRVAAGVLSRQVAALPGPEGPDPRPRRWGRQWTLDGDAWRATQLRAHLTADRRPPGGPAQHRVVLGGPLDHLLASAWSTRAFGDGVRSWETTLDIAARHDRLPPRADLTRIAREAAAVLGRRRVHVVLDPAAAPALLGVRQLPTPTPLPGAVAADLVRRVARASGVLLPTGQRRWLLHHRVAPALAGLGGPAVRVPHRHRAWVLARAQAMAEELRRAGYAVHGDPDHLLPAPPDHPEPTGATPQAVLQLATRLLLDPHWADAPTPTPTTPREHR